MEGKYIQLYCGGGTGKTSAAIGQGLKEACMGKTVYLVQCLKGKSDREVEYLKRLEPEFKIFRFDHFEKPFSELTPEEQQEEKGHIRNGIAFARKALSLSECDMLILDEVLQLPEEGIMEVSELLGVIRAVQEGETLIMTGTRISRELWPYVDEVTEVTTDFRSGDAEA